MESSNLNIVNQNIPKSISEMTPEEIREHVEKIRAARSEANLKRITERAAKLSTERKERGPAEIGNVLDDILGDL